MLIAGNACTYMKISLSWHSSVALHPFLQNLLCHSYLSEALLLFLPTFSSTTKSLSWFWWGNNNWMLCRSSMCSFLCKRTEMSTWASLYLLPCNGWCQSTCIGIWDGWEGIAMCSCFLPFFHIERGNERNCLTRILNLHNSLSKAVSWLFIFQAMWE